MKEKPKFATKMPDRYDRMKKIIALLGADPDILDMEDCEGRTIREEFGAGMGEFAKYASHPLVQASVILDYATSGRYSLQANGSSEARTRELVDSAARGQEAYEQIHIQLT